MTIGATRSIADTTVSAIGVQGNSYPSLDRVLFILDQELHINGTYLVPEPFNMMTDESRWTGRGAISLVIRC
jgi:hypothetical protein